MLLLLCCYETGEMSLLTLFCFDRPEPFVRYKKIIINKTIQLKNLKSELDMNGIYICDFVIGTVF